jgi:hypothetical protein
VSVAALPDLDDYLRLQADLLQLSSFPSRAQRAEQFVTFGYEIKKRAVAGILSPLLLV